MLSLTEAFIAIGDTDLQAVGRVYSEWAGRARDRGDIQTLSYLISMYGFSLLQNGHPARAGPLFEEALAIERRLENRDMILYMLDGLACEAAMSGRPQRAARLLGAAENLQAETGIRLMQHMEPLIKQARETISASLGAAALESETEAGRPMVMDEAIAYPLGEKKPSRVAAPQPRTSTMRLSKRDG